MILELARNVMARHLVANAIRAEWDMYPEIGEYDWEKIVKEADRLAENFRPPLRSFHEAYQMLADQARDEED